ncbi:MAG: class I SAM-dependent methyltransferase [Acidobacteria bacterium]|nr:class I SAM-dependent methyltransferase [Acidobacteriota bacterium]
MESLPLGAEINAFWETLQAHKAAEPDFPWYPYDSLGGLYEFEPLLAGRWNELTGGGPVLDVCAADGDVSFFLESQGCQVTAIDYSPTNFNGMRGIARMKALLASPLRVVEMDIDSRFTLGETYRFAIFMGGLYHLKNPFQVLETLARHCRYAIVSTRVARFTPDRSLELKDSPVAYLLAGDEANADPSNFWIFSETGLRRLLERSGWRVDRFTTMGCADSDPASNANDERAFCLLESLCANWKVQPVSGCHAPESGGWRWTERRFSLQVVEAGPGRLRVKLAWPEALASRLGANAVTVSRPGVPPRRIEMPAAGEYTVEVELDGGAETVFELDQALTPDAGGDQRELGVVLLEAAAE